MKVLAQIPISRRVARSVASRVLAWAGNEENADARTNGEDRFLAWTCDRWAEGREGREFVALDVGANEGSYSSTLLAASASRGVRVRVIALEPGAASFAALCKRLPPGQSFEALRLGASDFDGEAVLHAPKPGATHASLFRRPDVEQPAQERVAITRLERVLDERELERVDLIKLDVEGAELAALRGLGAWLVPSRCRLIQFEYGGTTLDAGARLRDFHDLLEPRGFVVCRLLPRALLRQRFQPWMETFRYANFVALAPDLVESP